MALELTILALSVVWLFVLIGTQSSLMTKDMGPDYNAGPRDETLDLGPKAGRAQRALANFLETYPAFIALTLIVAVTEGSWWLTQLGAILYLGGRVAHLPLYVMGVKYVRSMAFLVAALGLLIMLVGLFF